MLVNSELLLLLTHFLLLMMLLFMEQSTVIEMLTSVVGPGPNHCQVECYNRGGCERRREERREVEEEEDCYAMHTPHHRPQKITFAAATSLY